jgi:hypothetical protein
LDTPVKRDLALEVRFQSWKLYHKVTMNGICVITIR